MGAISFPDPNAPDPALAGDLVESRFGLSTGLVQQYDAAAAAAISALAESNFSVPMDNIVLDDSAIDAPNIGEAPIPTAVTPYESQMQAVGFPDIAALRDLLNLVEITIGQIDLPALDAVSPQINLPDTPDATLPDVPTDVPVVSDPALPTAPGLDLPPVPVLEDISLPSAPDVAVLSFDAIAPSMDLTPPEPMFIYDEATYQSDLADALKTKLYNDVTLGGTGLAPEVEQAMWDRALTRLNIELDKVTRQILNDWGGWNCEMPDGVLSSALREAMFEDNRSRLDLNRDIMFKQAELAQQQTQFAITSGMVYEKQIMDFTNQVNQRAFEVAKTRVQMVIDIFGLKVSAYNAQMEGFKALAQVFESRIRAELAKVELYRAQMEGAKILGELQVQKVAIYTARVQALGTLIDLYRAQMDGAKLQVDIDRAKIDAFKARIDAAVAQIGGVTAKFNLYQAQIAGETSKVDLFGKQVQAYATQVGAAKTVADIDLAQAQAQVEANKDKIALLTAAIDKYKADTQYEIGKDETGAKVYTAQVGGYTAEVGREGEYLRARVDSYRAQVSDLTARSELLIKELEVNLRTATAMQETQLEALKAVATMQTQKVASALTSVSASAQIGFNASVSDAYSRSASESNVSTISSSTDDRTVHEFIVSSQG